MGKLSAEERPIIGQLANEIRADIEGKIAEKSAEIKKNELEKRLLGEKNRRYHARKTARNRTQAPAFHSA